LTGAEPKGAIDGQLKIADDGIFGQRKDINALDCDCLLIAKALRHLHLRHGTVDLGDHAVLLNADHR
jgi:hypothetical protein